MILDEYGTLLETCSYDYEENLENNTITLNGNYFRYNSDINDIDGAIRTKSVRRKEMIDKVIERKKITYVKGVDCLEVVNNDDDVREAVLGITSNGIIALPNHPIEDQYIRCVTVYSYENAENKDEDSYDAIIRFRDRNITISIDKNCKAILTEYADYSLFRTYLSTDDPTKPDTKFLDIIYINSECYSAINEESKTINVISLCNKKGVNRAISYHRFDHEFDMVQILPDIIQVEIPKDEEGGTEETEEPSESTEPVEREGCIYIYYDEKIPFLIDHMRYNGSDVLIDKMVSKSLENNNTYYWYECIYPLYFCNNFRLNEHTMGKLWAYEWCIVTNDDIQVYQRMIYYVEDVKALYDAIKNQEDPLRDRYKNGYIRADNKK